MSELFDESGKWAEVDDALHKARTLVAALQEVVTTVPDISNPLEAAVNLAYLVHVDANRPTQVRRYARLLEEQLAIMSAITRPKMAYPHASDASQAIDRVELRGSNGES